MWGMRGYRSVGSEIALSEARELEIMKNCLVDGGKVKYVLKTVENCLKFGDEDGSLDALIDLGIENLFLGFLLE